MSNLRVTSLRGRTSGVSPTLPDGAVVTGVTTTTTLAVTGVATAASSVVAGIVTTNASGVHAGVEGAHVVEVIVKVMGMASAKVRRCMRVVRSSASSAVRNLAGSRYDCRI